MSRKVSALESLLHNGDIDKVLSNSDKALSSKENSTTKESVERAPKRLIEDTPSSYQNSSAHHAKTEAPPSKSRSKKSEPRLGRQLDQQLETRAQTPKKSIDPEPLEKSSSKVEVATPTPTPSSQGKSTNQGTIVFLSPSIIKPWSYADRPDSEVSGIEDLADDIKHNGQSSPILVRTLEIPDGPYHYEYIFGCRRLAACQLVGVDVKAMVIPFHELSDSRAFALMFGENEQRKNISSWARSVSFQNVLNNGVYSSKRELSLAIGKHESYIKNLTIYSKIPKAILDAIGPMTNVSINTAQLIESLARAPENIPKLIQSAEKIREGISPKSLKDRVVGRAPRSTSQRYSGKKGATLFFTKSDDGNVNIKFSAQDKEPADFDKIAQMLLTYLEDGVN